MVLSFEPAGFDPWKQGNSLQTALSGAYAQPQATGTTPTATTSPSFNDYNNLWNIGLTAGMANNVATDNTIANLYNKVGLGGALAGLNRNQVNQQAGFDRQRLGMSKELLGDQKQELGARRGDIDYWHNRQMQNFMGGQAARGATHTEGTTRGIGDFENERARLLRQLGMDERQLGRSARNLGIQEEELGMRVQNALDQIGLNEALSLSDIFQAISDAEAGRFNPLQNLLGYIYQLSGIRPVATSSGTQDLPMAATKEVRVR